ncbi:MAG: hypothetical protein HND27_05150 [Bacteroidetes bacterium]|nr:hypothetical protein [Bacteroidota bacterium]NOG95147.1 hypothetical protein [Bacteroidota bacterium]
MIYKTHHTTFGSTQPNPNNLNANQYRYGFGGMEQDKQSSSYTTYFRQYDPRIARWKSTDPVTQPWQSPYTAFDNNPIFYTDPSGAIAVPNKRRGIGAGGGIGGIGGALAGSAQTVLSLAIRGGMQASMVGTYMQSAMLPTSSATNSGRELGVGDNKNIIKKTLFNENALKQTFINLNNEYLASNRSDLGNDFKKFILNIKFWGEESVPYTGSGIGRTNFIGSGPNKNPKTLGLDPIDEIDMAAYFHDIAYFKAKTGGFRGARFELRVAFADLQLINWASSIIDRYYQGDIDIVTHLKISEKTYNLARAVYIFFAPIVIEKYKQLGVFNPYIRIPTALAPIKK